MADADIAITAGSGTKVDTRTVGAGTDEHRQVVVIGDPTTAANVCLVSAAGAQLIEPVAGAAVIARRDLQPIRVLSAGLTIATTAYTVGDQVGTIFTLASAARASGGTGTIVGVTLTDVNDIIGAYDVVFFNQTVTLAADNAAFSISDAHSLFAIQIAQLAGAFDIGNNRIAQASNLAIPYDCSGSTNLYAALICRVAHTFFTATTDLQLTVFVERN